MSSKWPYPRLCAHRGAGRFAPENTLASMRCGADYGFEMVEFDAKLSQDNVPILLHDDTVDRTSDGHGAAAKMDYKTLAGLDMGSWHSAYYSGEPLPALENIVKFCLENQIHCNIEIKPCPGREAETGKIIAKAAARWWKHADHKPLLSSFSAVALEAAMKVSPELPRAFLCEQYDSEAKKQLKRLKCVAINPDQAILTEKLIKELHRDGYKICTWTVNDYRRAKQLLAWGCDLIITDEMQRIPPSL